MKTLDDLVNALMSQLGAAEEDKGFIESKVKAVLSRVRIITNLHLWPKARFRDTRCRALSNDCACSCQQGAIAGQYPVVDVESVEGASSEYPIENISFSDTEFFGLPNEHCQIEYIAGYDDLPADVFEVILSAVRVSYQDRVSGGAGSIKKVSVVDVGSIDYGSGAGWFGDSGSLTTDPVLGPLVSVLNPYINFSSDKNLLSTVFIEEVANAP